jgi:hypothetical protein
MNWINSLERKFGRYAIPGLIRIIVFFQAMVFVLYMTNPQFINLLILRADLVEKGELWRLVSYIFIPQLGGSSLMPDYLWMVFRLLFTWMLGDGLESVWGSFKLNLYFFLGMIGTIIAAFAFNGMFDGWLLYYSLLFAFATIDPDYQIFMFFFPLKIKWLAFISLGFLLLGFLTSTLAGRMSVLFALANYLIFFGPEILRTAKHGRQVAGRRERFKRAAARDDDAMHRCEVCNRTEISNPDLDFRVSADGHEYCMEHLPAKPPVT